MILTINRALNQNAYKYSYIIYNYQYFPKNKDKGKSILGTNVSKKIVPIISLRALILL